LYITNSSLSGKPYSVALNEDLPETITTFRYYSGWADKVFGQTISTTHQKFAYTIRQPIGVVAQIIPWNYPLACGNTIVLKPAEQTPLSALYLARLIQLAGFPPGVVNVVNGLGVETGSALVTHPLVDKVAFTGSTTTARTIMSLASRTLKNITLETGGKSPLLIFSDADAGIMSNQGQICTATSRILVHKPIYNAFITSFLSHLSSTSVLGPQWSPSTFQGPQISRAQLDRILSYVSAGLSEGATLLTGGSASPINSKGFFMQPTVFTHVTDTMRIWNEEVFGPFAVIGTFEDEAEAIARANASEYGLGAAVFTRDLERAHRVAAEIEAGMVWVNSSQDSDPRVPFGGVKQSGIGRELGEAGLEAYTQVKAVHVNMGSKL
jgi:aldehyde dehydrogenase (NAD+)